MRASFLVAVLVAVSSLSGCVVVASGNGERGDRQMREQGWDKLGERWVNGQSDKDRIEVGRADGKFRQLMIVVEHSAVDLDAFDVEFANGSHFTPELRARFDENSRSRVIDLPGDARTIRHITFRAGNIPGGGRAQIEVWGR
jgi:hypothetical protein